MEIGDEEKATDIFDRLTVKPNRPSLPVEKSIFNQSRLLEVVCGLTSRGSYREAIDYFRSEAARGGVYIVTANEASQGTEWDQQAMRGKIFVKSGFSRTSLVAQLFLLQHAYKSLFLRKRDLRDDKGSLFELLETDYDFLQRLLLSGNLELNEIERLMAKTNESILLLEDSE